MRYEFFIKCNWRQQFKYLQKMQAKHEQTLKEDAEDLQILVKQVDKVQKLKRQYIEQKQEIGELNQAINELKSENQELKSHSCFNSHHEDDLSDDPVAENKDEISSNSQHFNKNRVHRVHRNGSNQRHRFREFPKNSQYSGFITAGRRMYSPQVNSHQANSWTHTTMNSIRDLRNRNGDLRNRNGRNDRINNYVKNKLIENFAADFKYEINQKEKQLQMERKNCRQFRQELEREKQKKQKLKMQNFTTISGYEVIERENQFLRQQFRKETEKRYESEEKLAGILTWVERSMRRAFENEEAEFRKMDEIYKQFERLYL